MVQKMTFFPKILQNSLKLAASYALFAAFTSSAFAAGGDEIKMKYDVYAVGVKVYKISLKMKINEKDYTSKVAVRAKGFIKFFSNAEIDISSSGIIGATNIAPRNYVMKSKSKGKKRNVKITWAKGVKPKATRNYKLNKWRLGQIDKVLRPEAGGPLTFLLRQAARAPAKPCTGSERVYTGKVVYEYSYKKLGSEEFTSENPGSYRGPALKCSLSMRPLAGLSAEKMAEVKAKPYPPYTIWYAPVAGSKATRLVPVAAKGKMKGQPFELRLKKGEIGGKSINSRTTALK